MVQTKQPHTLDTLSEAEKGLIINEPETEDKKNLMQTLCDSLNEFYDKLNILDNVMEKKIIEHNLSQKDK